MSALTKRLEAQRDAAVKAAEAMAKRGDLTLTEETLLEQTLDTAERASSRLALVEPRSAAPAVVRREPLTYERGGEFSFFLDFARAGVHGDGAAKGRLDRHRAEMDVEIPRREGRRRAEFERLAEEGRWGVERRTLSRVNGAGGDFVPPTWLSDLFAPTAGPGRVLAALSRNLPLPTGTDAVNIPKVTSGAAVASQTADNAAPANVDMITGVVNCPVRTITGAADVALQLLEQAAPLGFDEVMFTELLSDYNASLAAQLVNGPGTAGTLQGVLGVAAAGGNVVTYTDIAPTVPKLWSKIANAAALSGTNRHLAPTAVLVIPARWFWVAAALDGQGRPLAPPSTEPPETDELPLAIAERANGTIVSLPTFMDSAIPANAGAGANQDTIVVARPDDFLLFESDSRLRVTLDNAISGSGVLGAKVTFYRYVAFTSALYPQGITMVAGTGLTPPVFA